ncbi:MAG: glutamate-1-semialdehyde 2,1-aminomutase [Planctomycetota bacterium]|nr:MAG: glutamate-1-semialdehyde 2,1-aminomutase [Planctomycetota bacterium]
MSDPTTAASVSAELYRRACRVMPGGVSSPVRAYRSVGGTPPFLAAGRGCRVRDEDGNEYLDFINSWGPLILGHAHPAVVEAVQQAAARGTSFGAPCRAETELAEKVVELSPVAERVRFVNSGTEATMSALRLARAATGRDGFVKFDGCYHGHGDPFLVKAGSGLATFGESSSAGVPADCARWTGVLPLDDEEALAAWFAAHGGETAAVFVEGIPANCGFLPQRPEWLARLRELTRAHGALLVVDEVITGFRLGPGGFCGREHYQADLVTYGKVIGGGLPVGAYGGRAELMDRISPEGGVYQAGTLSGNPLCMAAGLAALSVLEREDGWSRLGALGSAWEERLRPLVERECAAGHPVALARDASIFWLCFGTEEAPRSFAAIPAAGAERYRRFFHALLRRGVMIAPSAYEVGFLSLAMDEDDLDQAAAAFAAALEESR